MHRPLSFFIILLSSVVLFSSLFIIFLLNPAKRSSSSTSSAWKTYINKTYGFSFQYPSDRTFFGNDTEAFFKTKEQIKYPGDFNQGFYVVPNYSQAAYIKSHNETNFNPVINQPVKQTVVTFNGYKFFKNELVNAMGNFTEFTIEHGNNLIIFFVGDQFLSTFKFTN